MARIENHKFTIEEAFRECFYIVPDYQREYVWTDKEVQQLFDDIEEQIDGADDREYFIGTILVAPTQKKNHFEVIDGQQRLTTFFLLLCALKHLFHGEPQHGTLGGLILTTYTAPNGNLVTSMKLDPRYENAGEAMAKIVTLETDPQATRAAIHTGGIRIYGSLENLLNAYGTLYRHLRVNYADKAKLRKFWGYLANNVVFIQISTDVSSALKIFETINERGVGLNPMDLLKNLIFTHVKEAEFTRLKDEWKKITSPLEKAKEKPLRFLRYFLMANYTIKNNRGDSVVREDEIYDWFRKDENKALCEYESKPFEFVRKINRNVEQYLNFAKGLGNDGQANPKMENLKQLCGGAFSLQYMLLLAVSSLPKPLFDHFVVQLENFLFYYIYTRSATKELERNFSIWADELREVCRINDARAKIEALNRFIADRFQKGMTTKEQELEDALKRYTLHSMQQYRTRYLLAKLTQHVDLAYKGLNNAGSLSEYTGLQIEHILPNTPKPEFLTDFQKENPGANYDTLKNRLGNLTLLEKPLNIVASNGYFEKKKAEYAKCKYYLTSSLAGLTEVGKNSTVTRMNGKLEAFPHWTAEAIDRRQGMLIGLARDVWKTTEFPVS